MSAGLNGHDYGAFGLWWEAGFRQLISDMPADAVIEEGCRGTPGKTPGRRLRNRKWAPLDDWRNVKANPEKLATWAEDGASVGLLNGEAFMLDVDAYDPEHAELIKREALAMLGPAKVRIGQAPKFALAYRCAGPEPIRIRKLPFGKEIDGKKSQIEVPAQAVVDGIHAKTGKPYDWPDGRPVFSEMSVVSQAQLAEFMRHMGGLLPEADYAETRLKDSGPVDQASLKGDLAMVAKAMRALPNNYETAPLYDDMIAVGEALHAATADDHSFGLELWHEWLPKFPDGRYDPEKADQWWSSFNVEHTIGADYIYGLAEKYSDGAFTRAEVFFDEIAEVENPFAIQAEREAVEHAAEHIKTSIAEKAARFQFLTPADLGDDATEGVSPLIKGLLDQGAMSVLFGASNVGKSFVAMDLSWHVATGMPYAGMRVAQGPVIYVAAEGGRGAKNRIRALKLKYPQHAQNRQFQLLAHSIDLLRPDADVVPLIVAIRELAEKMGAAPVLLVVDTLARAMSGGDENSSEAMGAIIKHMDALREAIKPMHLMAIHHTGKNAEKGARGHSSLRAAVDTEIEVTEGLDGVRHIEVTKQRDLERALRLEFVLDGVVLGVDGDGDPVKSCTVRLIEQGDGEGAKGTVTAGEQAVLDGLTTLRDTAETEEEHAKIKAKGIKTGDIVAFMADVSSGKLTEHAVKSTLKRLHAKGFLTQPQYAHWALKGEKSVSNPFSDVSADSLSITECVSQCVKDIFQ